jgi:hypothetical protein
MILFSIVWFCSFLGIHRQTLDAPDISDIWMVKVDQSRYSSTASVEHQGHDLGVVWCSSTKHGHIRPNLVEALASALWTQRRLGLRPLTQYTSGRSVLRGHISRSGHGICESKHHHHHRRRRRRVNSKVACKWMFISLGFDQLKSSIKSTYVLGSVPIFAGKITLRFPDCGAGRPDETSPRSGVRGPPAESCWNI